MVTGLLSGSGAGTPSRRRLDRRYSDVGAFDDLTRSLQNPSAHKMSPSQPGASFDSHTGTIGAPDTLEGAWTAPPDAAGLGGSLHSSQDGRSLSRAVEHLNPIAEGDQVKDQMRALCEAVLDDSSADAAAKQRAASLLGTLRQASSQTPG